MIFGFDEFELDVERFELRQHGKPLQVEGLILQLLAMLVRNAGRLVSKEELVDAVWEGRPVADNVITVSMARLRKTLGDRRGEREFVVTVYGRGYRFARRVVSRSAGSGAAPELSAAVTPTPPFVGRERVLARLRQALGEAHAGRGRLCVLMGEPGIGKTSVVEAFEREIAGAPLQLAWGYCREAGDTPPLWPWLRLLRALIAAAGSKTQQQQRLDALPKEAQALLHESATAGPPEPGGSATGWVGPARHPGFDAILRSFVLAAEQTPWVLVLDDLHRADAASLELLSLLLDEIARSSILVIATLRHTQGRAPRPETHLPQVLGHRNCERITLDRLRADDVATYVAAVLEDPDGSLGRSVFAKSEGNPFFMAELSRQLKDAEQVDRGALVVPASALELIRQRISRLDEDTRAVLASAAVIGRSFELPLLAAVTRREPSLLMHNLDDALGAEVVVAAPDSITAFAFGHELLRAVLYDALAPAEQRRLHLQIGAALELRIGAGDAVAPSEIAYHYYAALPGGDPRKTVHFCRAAAAAAAAVLASPDVVRYARHALEALDLTERPSVRLRISLLYMMAIYARGHAPAEFARSIREVLRLAREHGDASMLVNAACMMNPRPGFAPMAGGGAALERALELLPPEAVPLRSIALSALACVAPQCYSAERSHALLAEALPLARRSGSRMALRIALESELYLRGGPDHAANVAQCADELERLAQQNPDRMPTLPATLAERRTITALQRGEPAAIEAALERAAATARELGNVEFIWYAERFAALARINAGALPPGLAGLQTLHRRAEQRAIIGVEPLCAFDRVVVFGELVETPALDDGLRSALEFDSADPPSIWSLKLRALAAAGLHDEARAALRALAPAELARLPCDSEYLGTLGQLARAALLLREQDYLEPIHALLLRYPDCFAGHVAFLCEGSVPQLLGMLDRALQRHAQAAERLETGMRMNERSGFAPRAAEAGLQLAECLLDQGRPDGRRRALALAQETHAAAARSGLPRLTREAEALLRRARG